MAIKYREAEELRLSTRKDLTATSENWMRFLKTASNTYKYSYSDQLMIAAQFPNATAVAAFDVWSDRFGRKIKAGEKGIGLIDDSGTYPKMKYVFDISQSERFRDVPQPYIWELREEFYNEAALYLAGDSSVSIEQSVSDYCESMVDSLIDRYEYDLLLEAMNSSILGEVDKTSIREDFRRVVLESVKYMALSRCGLDTSLVDEKVFDNLYNFSELQITDIIGNSISDISEQILREIENTVKTIERRKQNERNNENKNDRRSAAYTGRGEYDILSDNKAGQTDRFDIYSRSGNVRVHSEHERGIGREGYRQMGTETQEVFERKQTGTVYADVRRPYPDGSSDRGGRSSGENDGQARSSDDGAGGRNGEAESNGSDGMGTPPELDREQSGGNNSERADLRIKQNKIKQPKAEEQSVSPVFSSFSVGEQMSLYADERSEQDKANEYAMSSLISAGTVFVDGKFRIFDYFSEQHTKEEKAKFLSNEYGWGGSYNSGDEFETRPGKGITMKHIDKDHPENNITVHLTYKEAADMIDFLIQNDRFITPKDIEERQQRAIYYLKNYNPDNPLEAPQIEQAKALLDSYNIDYSQLLENQPTIETATPERVEDMNASIPDDAKIPDINASSVPIEQEDTVYYESAVVAEFRNKTTESFHLIGGRTEFDIELEVEELLRQEMVDNEIAGDIEAVVLYGSRSRGLETSEDTDIDIVVQINNSELKEDALFNLFSDMTIEIDGIPVDINPIRPEETGTLDEYLPKAEAYLEQKQDERAAQIFSSSVGKQEMGFEVPKIGVMATIGLSESQYVDDILDKLKDPEGKVSFSLINAVMEYLDEKQHYERYNPNLHSGWYDKTDFEINAVINENDSITYSGRFDIGDGKGTGGGSLIDHISDWTEYNLTQNPFHKTSKELAEHRRIKDELIPFLHQHKQLTSEEEKLFEKIKAEYPILTTKEQYEALIGKPVYYDERQYILEKLDFNDNKATIRDDNTGWYPISREVNLLNLFEQNAGLLPTSQKKTIGTYKIYQLKDGDENRYKRFEGLERQPESVSISDYDLVYEGTLSDTYTLEGIYEQFNINRPEDFTGHSLSVSDVVVIEQDGQQQAHFVDSIGFKDVPDFFVERKQKAEQTPKQPKEADNYRITDLSLGQRKPLEKFRDNLAAVRTLKQIETEGRPATPEEQEILSKYTGWGGMAKVFEPDNRHYQEVRELLTDDEFEAARKSTMTAFYTSPVIIKEMYAKLADMGMNGGRLLEPSCGIGNFIGMMPGSNTRVTGIELDSLTGRIAKVLYPQADIQVCGFENSKLKENSFDVAVGNVPFGDIRVYDRKYNPNNLLIHDYFFSKSLDMVKPGGVVAFITSKGTLDKLDPTARRLLAEKADFLGAVRLPNNAFKANAGTEVTSDIIFLQKRTEPLKIMPENEPLWIKTATDSNGIEMNAYFATHPEQICGTMTMVSGPYGMESTCEPNREIKLSEQLSMALSNIQGKIETVTVLKNEEVGREVPVAAPESLRNSSYFLSDGKPFFYESGESTPVKFPKSKAKKNLAILTEMIATRDTVRQLLEMQLDESVSDDEIKAVQANLAAMYDKFAEKYGRINDKANTDLMKGDSSLPLLKSLERFDEEGQYIGKADIFSKRTIKAEHIVTEVDTSVDALAVSLGNRAKVDLEYMVQLTGFDRDKIIADLKGSIYKIPETDRYVTADEYLSGNVLEKLNTARRAFDNGDTSLAVNITALQKAMPERLTATDIDVRLGSTWIKPEYIRDFIYQLLGTPNWNKNPYSPKQYIDVQYSDVSGEWFITNKSADKGNIQACTTYGTDEITAYQLIENALNLKTTTITVKEIVDGKKRYVVDETATAKARAKQDLILQKFKEWIFADKSRRDDLVDTYNRQFNSTRPREYDGSHLNFVGMNPEIQLRPHQLNAVARCLYGGNTLLAHEVGAGKTFEMIAAAMEGKRLGLHSKSLICVPDHLTEQVGGDFLKLYPNANILVARKKDFEEKNRKALMAKISTGNYDAIIIGHSQLKKIPVSQERQQQFIKHQIDETMHNIEELKATNGEKFQIKQAEKTKANLESKLQKLLDSSKDDTVTFEELGIDKLFLDEAHLFKNLFLSTKMNNVSGVSTSSDVEKTADLFVKTQYLDELTGGKGIVFATGTPVSNTMCEIYNMMRYLQMDLLREKHLEHFDCWASTFGENVTQMELAPEGNTYRAKTRFSKFFNLPELMAMFKECADIQTADTLNLPGIPECEVHNVAVEPTETQKALVDSLSQRAEAIHDRLVDPSVDNMLKLTTDGRKIGLDQRLINPDLPDEPGTKVNACVGNVLNIWNATENIRGTQLIFCDYSTPKNDGSFNVYDDIKTKLIDGGIPEEQIAFIHDATNEVKREELFSKVRSGEIRVLIGSTSKMGAGTNVQDRLVASHDLDAPYRPADMEQRRGRMVRQGNRNNKVHLYRYCTKDTFDAYLFQMLERKQSFISQIMTSKSPQRRCDDIDEATLSYAEVKALCVGDPRIKEKMELDNEIGKLRLERSSHQQEQYRLEDMAENIKGKIKILETNIPKNQNDFLFCQKHPIKLDEDGKKIFEGIKIHGKTYTDKKDAAEAFKNAYMTAIRQGGGHRDYVPVGEYRGFQVAVLFDSFSQTYKATLSREGTYYLDLGADNFTRMDNVLDKLESICKERIDRLSTHKKELSEVTKQIGKPFAKEDEFQAKSARLTVLNAELDVDGKKNEQGGITKDGASPEQSRKIKR